MLTLPLPSHPQWKDIDRMMAEYKPPAEDEVIDIRSREVQGIRKHQDSVLLHCVVHACCSCACA